MKINVNGEVREMTPDEMNEYEATSQMSGSPSESDQITELRRMIEALANGDTGVTA